MVLIQKANGSEEVFSEEKLRHSIQRAGIPHELEDTVVAHVKESLHEHIPTSEIYKHIIEYLEKTHIPYAKAKYSLKQALMDLGPTGYPFEDYVAALLSEQNYQTTTRSILNGKCVTHEVDVVATNGSEKLMVEAKYHNSVGIKTDIQVSLYTHARFEDLIQKNSFTQPMLITNTKATTDAIAYAECVGMRIVTWSYPEGNSLRDWVEKSHMYPITALSSLSQSQKQQLLQAGIVMARDVCHDPSILESITLPEDTKKRVIEEARYVCNAEK